MDFRHIKRPRQQALRLDTCTRDALADICRERWPAGTAKLAAREWRLTLDQGRSVVAGRASQTTIDQIFKAGGWPVYFAVGARVLGRGADQYLSELRADHEEQTRRAAGLVRIFALWLVILLAIIVWWPLNLIANGALTIGEWARDRIEELSA